MTYQPALFIINVLFELLNRLVVLLSILLSVKELPEQKTHYELRPLFQQLLVPLSLILLLLEGLDLVV